MPTLRQIAEWVAATDEAPESGEIVGVASIERAMASDVVFAMDAAALERATLSAAGCILARAQDAEHLDDPRVLRVHDPRYAFAILGERLAPMQREGVHASAVIGVDVVLGAGVSIGAGAVVGDFVRIGAGTRIDARVVIYDSVEIGARCVVQAGAVLGSMGFGYARSSVGDYLRFPQQGRLVIEDEVEIGANTTIDRGALDETRIGHGSKLDNLVHIGHNCVIGRNVVIAAQTGISGSSVVEDGAILGGQVGIGEHATVGEGVILGGGAGVLSGKKLRGAGEVFWGRPAQPLKEYLKSLAKLRKL